MTTTLYDADGEVTETIDPLGRITTSLYDADGRLVEPDLVRLQRNVVNTESFTYDADGNVLTAAERQRHVHDDLRRAQPGRSRPRTRSG